MDDDLKEKLRRAITTSVELAGHRTQPGVEILPATPAGTPVIWCEFEGRHLLGEIVGSHGVNRELIVTVRFRL